MKTKPLSKFTNKTGINCFMIPNQSNRVGFHFSGSPEEVNFLTANGAKVYIPPTETSDSELGRKNSIDVLNSHIEADGFILAPQRTKIVSSVEGIRYEVKGDVVVSNYFGDKLLHVGKGKAKVKAISIADGSVVKRCKLSQGMCVYLSHMDSDYDYKEEGSTWIISPPANRPIVNTSQIFINRCSHVVARIKTKHWLALPNTEFVAVNKAKVKLLVGDKKVGEIHVSAGTVFHEADFAKKEDGKLFFNLYAGHVIMTQEYVKVDYKIMTNLEHAITKANSHQPSNKKDKSSK